MTAKELFAVGVRLVGIVTALNYLPAIVLLHYIDAAPGVIGLILLTRADQIANLCYPTDAQERLRKDYRES